MFYIIERQDQLDKLGPFKDCFVRFIRQNDNFHPKLSPLNLIYVRDLAGRKGYILCLDHNESFSLDQSKAIEWLNNSDKIFVLDKKESMYSFPYPDKLYDINFIERPDLTEALNIPAINFYYSNHTNNPIVNKLIPISKHYEESENIFDAVFPIIQKYRAEDVIYAFNNGPFTRVFYEIESTGIKVDKQCFIDSYGETLKYPEYNLRKGRIYSQYNLYTITGRPSNTYNSINFAALNKNNGERLCYRPQNDKFVEFDYKAFHIAILSNLIGYKWETEDIHNELGKQYFNKSELTEEEYKQSKNITFSQIYGYIRNEYKQIPFFKQMQYYIDDVWKQFQTNQMISTSNRIFTPSIISNPTPNKLLNYIIQSYETSINVEILTEILRYMSDKKSNIILYVYDSYLIDLDENEHYVIKDIKEMIKQKGFNVSIKMGKDYQRLSKV